MVGHTPGPLFSTRDHTHTHGCGYGYPPGMGAGPFFLTHDCTRTHGCGYGFPLGMGVGMTSVSKSSWQLVQRLATGLDRN